MGGDPSSGGLNAIPPNIRKDDPKTGAFIDIKFIRDDENGGQIKMKERRGRVIQTTQKISKAAIKRQKNWKKFGSVSQIPKGVCEEGVTAVRDSEVRIQWVGQSKREQEAAAKAARMAQLRKKRHFRMMADKQRQANSELSAALSPSVCLCIQTHLSLYIYIRIRIYP